VQKGGSGCYKNAFVRTLPANKNQLVVADQNPHSTPAFEPATKPLQGLQRASAASKLFKNACSGGPEKAGFGGSIPSLATALISHLRRGGWKTAPAIHPQWFQRGDCNVLQG
jgi:hypothetical protein